MAGRRKRSVVFSAVMLCVLLISSVGCGAEGAGGGRDSVSPMEDQFGNPKVYWHHQSGPEDPIHQKS